MYNVSLVDTYELYVKDIKKFPLLTPEEETFFAMDYFNNNNLDAAKRLIESNLRFVLKVVHEFKGYDMFENMKMEFVQEGNIGLMRAVQKFDPTKGIRLITYAVFWIRAQIREFLMANWGLVKLNTTQKSRKLFYNTEKHLDDDTVSDADVVEMLGRKESYTSLSDRFDDSDATLQDALISHHPTQDMLLEDLEYENIRNSQIANILKEFDEREQIIIRERIMADEPKTFQVLSEVFGVSRERVRQLERNILDKLRNLMDKQELLCYTS